MKHWVIVAAFAAAACGKHADNKAAAGSAATPAAGGSADTAAAKVTAPPPPESGPPIDDAAFRAAMNSIKPDTDWATETAVLDKLFSHPAKIQQDNIHIWARLQGDDCWEVDVLMDKGKPRDLPTFERAQRSIDDLLYKKCSEKAAK